MKEVKESIVSGFVDIITAESDFIVLWVYTQMAVVPFDME